MLTTHIHIILFTQITGSFTSEKRKRKSGGGTLTQLSSIFAIFDAALKKVLPNILLCPKQDVPHGYFKGKV